MCRIAIAFHCSFEETHQKQLSLLNGLAHRFLTPSIIQTVATRFPRFQPLLERWYSEDAFSLSRDPYSRNSWGETRSAWYNFVQYTLNLISQHPDYVPAATAYFRWPRDNYGSKKFDAAKVAKPFPPAWSILGSEKVLELFDGVHSGARANLTFGRFAFSAASLAIRFLQSVPNSTRAHIREVVLVEDQPSIANAPSHSQGLLSYCRENPRLRVKRVVNLWKSSFWPDVS